MTMQMYLASAWERADEMDRYARILKKLGHDITSVWHSDKGRHFIKKPLTGDQARYNASVAVDDLERLKNSEAITYFPTRKYGAGHHTEFGFAIAHGLKPICVGEPIGVFPWLPMVLRFANWEAFLEAATPESHYPNLSIVPPPSEIREGDGTEDGVS